MQVWRAILLGKTDGNIGGLDLIYECLLVCKRLWEVGVRSCQIYRWYSLYETLLLISIYYSPPLPLPS